MITFSVVTITYNAAAVLQRTLDSVRQQTWQSIEHIIVDGNSADETVAMARKYADEVSVGANGIRVTLVSEPDKGLYDAMNKGIRMASGDYLLFLNAGDTLPEADTLARVAAVAESVGSLPGVIYGDTDVVDGDGRFIRHRRLSPPDRLTWKSFRWGMLVCHQAFYAQVSLAKETAYNLGYRYSADVDWCIRIMKLAAKKNLALANAHAVVVNYLDGGLSVKNHRRSLCERFQVMRTHYGLFATVIAHGWFVVRGLLKR